MGRLLLTGLLLIMGLLWKTAPEKRVSQELPMTGAAVFLAATGEAADFSAGPYPSAQCASCHADHYREWSRSFHARSLTSEDFLRTFPQYLDSLGSDARSDPQASMVCFSCHAPLLKNAEPRVVRQVTTLVLAKETKRLDGFEVGCIACHLDGNRVFSGPIHNPQKNPFHESKFSPSYKEASFCSSCHTSAPTTVPCSDVYSDWKQSRAAKQGRTCQGCHMAERSGIAAAEAPQRKIHSHVFPGARSAAMLEQAVAIRLKAAFREDRLDVIATVRNRTPHRVPDG